MEAPAYTWDKTAMESPRDSIVRTPRPMMDEDWTLQFTQILHSLQKLRETQDKLLAQVDRTASCIPRCASFVPGPVPPVTPSRSSSCTPHRAALEPVSVSSVTPNRSSSCTTHRTGRVPVPVTPVLPLPRLLGVAEPRVKLNCTSDGWACDDRINRNGCCSRTPDFGQTSDNDRFPFEVRDFDLCDAREATRAAEVAAATPAAAAPAAANTSPLERALGAWQEDVHLAAEEADHTEDRAEVARLTSDLECLMGEWKVGQGVGEVRDIIGRAHLLMRRRCIVA